MSDAVLIQLIVSAATIITILVTGWLNHKGTNSAVDKVTKQTDAQTATLTQGQVGLDSSVQGVHDLVNGRLTAALSTIEDLKKQVSDLTGLVAGRK